MSVCVLFFVLLCILIVCFVLWFCGFVFVLFGVFVLCMFVFLCLYWIFFNRQDDRLFRSVQDIVASAKATYTKLLGSYLSYTLS